MANWFKMLWLNSEEREILKRAKEKSATAETVSAVTASQTATGLISSFPAESKAYKNVFYSNRNLTVVFKDGTMLSKSNVGRELFNEVKAAPTQEDIELLMIDTTVYETPPPTIKNTAVETMADRELVSNNLDVFKNKNEFQVKAGEIYLRGVNLPMPAPVAESFIELLEKRDAAISGKANRDVIDGYEEALIALKMFWLKLALNTLPQSREDLLVFCRKNDIRITRNGNLILYRRIVTKTGADTQFVTFITQNYYKVKKDGLDTRNFAVGKTGDGYELVDLLKYDGTGTAPFMNLQVAYLELPTFETNTFTSAHDKNVEIKLGGIYSIPDSQINLNNGICAAGGLHAAAVDYNYSGFGDMPVVVLVNPSKAITVPVNETGKLRTTEMFVACVNDKPQGVHFDESALSAFDAEYHDLTLEQLEQAAKNKSFQTLSVKDTVPAVSLVDLGTIKDMLKNRVSKIV